MNNEELLKILNDKYETILTEDKELSIEFEKLVQEYNELYHSDKIKKLEEKEYILKNGKSFKGKLKSFFASPTGGAMGVLNNIFDAVILLVLAGAAYIGHYEYIIAEHKAFPEIGMKILYFFDALLAGSLLAIPISSIININKVNKKYKLEDVSLELENAKKRKEVVVEELELKKSLHEIKKQKLDELEGAIKSIEEIMNTQREVDNFGLANEQTVDLNISEEGKTLKLERK